MSFQFNLVLFICMSQFLYLISLTPLLQMQIYARILKIHLERHILSSSSKQAAYLNLVYNVISPEQVMNCL